MLTDELREKLIERAAQARKRAYAAYSHYAVGAAVLSDTGKIFEGGNIENAVYPLTLCAERVAIFKAVSEGEMTFDVIAVVTENGGTPCGACRQVMAEFAPDAIVLIADVEGHLLKEMSVRELLPFSFGKQDLE